MKRDMTLCRDILLAVEASRDDEPASIKLPYEHYSDVVMSRHVQLLAEGGLIHAIENHRIDAGLSWQPHALTWQGHDFLAAVRSDAVWQRLVHDETTDKPFALIVEAATDTVRKAA